MNYRAVTPVHPPTYLGYEALVRRFQLKVPPLKSVSVGVVRAVERHVVNADGEERVELPLQRLRGTSTIEGQLTFALKRERLNLTVLAALFEHEEVIQAIQAWLEKTPASKYARMTGHLVEWLSGRELVYQLPPGTPREKLLDEKAYIPGPSIPYPKYGINHNLIGSKHFSPLIKRTEKLNELLAEDMASRISDALGKLDPELLARAVDYLFLAETRSTYNIENEIPDNNREAKFRRLLEQAGEPVRLTEMQLTEWQGQIVDALMTEVQYRNGQNWLSRAGRVQNIADYIPPPADLVEPMMEGVADVADLGRTKALHPVLAAACAAYGLVYVHPFYDGNGRLHRFLLHHVLRQSGFTPASAVLPISARMLKQLARYAAILKSYSRPRTELIDYLLDSASGTILLKSAQPQWLYAYFDATELCEFTLECVKQCVEQDLSSEVAYLQAHDATVAELGRWLNMRQSQLNTLINVIVQGGGTLSNGKRKLVEGRSDEQVALIVETVARNFADYFKRISS